MKVHDKHTQLLDFEDIEIILKHLEDPRCISLMCEFSKCIKEGCGSCPYDHIEPSTPETVLLLWAEEVLKEFLEWKEEWKKEQKLLKK